MIFMWKKTVHNEDIRQENAAIREQAGADMTMLLENWRKYKRHRKFYRCGLCGILVCASLILGGLGYYNLYNQVPSVLRIKADMEQTFDLGVPLTGEMVAVSGQEESNIPAGAVHIDLSRQVTMTVSPDQSYQMNVKIFGILPFKQVGIQVIRDQELTPVGVPIGIYVKAEGLLVVGVGDFQGLDGISYCPAKYVVKSGDYILALDGEPVTTKTDFVRRVEACQGREVTLQIKRGEEILDVKAQPVQNSDRKYKLGIWIRDNAQGVGTLTFVDEQGNFGALGHGITDSDTGELMELGRGSLYDTRIVAVRKGTDGVPGELTGMIEYDDTNVIGEITKNTPYGIFGKLDLEKMAESGVNLETREIGFKQDIHLGPATMISSVNDEMQEYDIEITAIHMGNDGGNKGLELLVTDERLLSLTGGIVQGMSGSPILQDGKVVGAVTHVLVNAPEKGYGIFIEEMLQG